MGNKIIKDIEEFTYGNIHSLDMGEGHIEKPRFVLNQGSLYLIKDIVGATVTLESGDLSAKEFITKLKVVTHNDIDYIVLTYINTNKIIILYKDIEYVGSYYGDSIEWFNKSYKFINDYFNNIIDGKVSKAIDEINIDSSSILEIVDAYALHNSRDLMLTHAIDKYAKEMAILLESISNKDNKKLFTGVTNTLKGFISPIMKQETELGKEIKVKTTPRPRAKATKKITVDKFTS